MAAAAESEQTAAAAREPPPPPPATAAPPPPTLDPRLLMAARRGDSGQLKDLLLLEDDDDDQQAGAAGTTDTTTAVDMPAAAEQVVVVQVDDHPPAAEPAPPPPSAAGGGGSGDEQEGTPEGTAAGMTSPLQAAAQDDDDIAEMDDPQPPASVGGGSRFPFPVPAPPPPIDGAALTMEGESLLHVVAGCCDCEELLCCAKMIARDKKRKGGAAAMRQLLEATNRRGDTPLHCAAAAGHAGMASCLVDLVAASTAADGGEDAAAVKKAFLEAQNNCGETALHHAVRSASCTKMHTSDCGGVKDQRACIDKLMALDPELACIDAHDGTSPLYLAISLGEMEIAEQLLDKAEPGKLSYSGPDGQNILHAAVSCGSRQALGMVLKWLKEPKTTTADEAGNNSRHETTTASADLLIKQLTSQGDKKNGSTPLHLAASLPGFPSTGLIPGWHWMHSSKSPMRLLLDENESTLYQADKEGLYPIHVAAGTVHPLAVKALLHRCPDCATLRDAKGRTFLHVAVEKNRIPVVRYVCLTSKLSWILNVQDNNGDTALHRAVHTGNEAIFKRLFWNPQVRLDVPNKDGMRPSDVSWSTMPLEAYYAWDPRMKIRNALLKVAAPYGETRGDLFNEKHAINQEFEGGPGKISEKLTSAAQVMGILSVLVTTVTFASAFTPPGGYRSAGDGGGVAGTPVLAGSYAFDVFLIADALAFICSLFATSLLLYAGVPAGTLRSRFFCVNRAYALMMNSGKSLVAAFGLGIYVALLPVDRTIPIVIAVWMAMLTIGGFMKASEGIDTMLFSLPVFPRRRGHLADTVLSWIVFVLDHFWCYMIIFGIPAIRKWARAR